MTSDRSEGTKASIQKITPFLWFDDQAKRAAEFYVSVFDDSRILDTTYYLEGSPGPAGSVQTVEFELDGMRFTALNGGPVFQFNSAISFVVDCDTQAEVDAKWDALLSGGGEPVQCGWLTDRFGLSWQVVPRILYELLTSSDKAAATRANAAMLKMIKLDIVELQRAFDGG